MSLGLIELIAKRARTETSNLLKDVNKMKEKIKETPSTIEKLVELEEYMNTIPSDLEKVDKNIQKSMEIY
jgi:hypothetical protein